ncbi:MAG: pantoate--beta-alanine ligase [Alphaproteobacteria bacterium]|nr:pantoate--beta-alanine ligase [Alphaproteobacteria bacterium]
MQTYHTLAEWRDYRRRLAAGLTLGFVPTMGSLHAGHLQLVRRARAENALVVVSIFVNPTQFGETEDFECYPRDLARDLEALHGLADVVFCPTADMIYPLGSSTCVEVAGISDMLLGAIRPGHFRGVATVVTKFLNLIQADRAYFGLKDYQQLQSIRRLVADLFMPTEIIALPTVREPDGLAMSSRNQRLSASERAAAVIIPKALEYAKVSTLSDPDRFEEAVRAFLAREPLAQVASVDVRDADTLEEISPMTKCAVLLLAVRFGTVLLIDQAELFLG